MNLLLCEEEQSSEDNLIFFLLIEELSLSQGHNCDHYFTFTSDNNSRCKYNRKLG